MNRTKETAVVLCSILLAIELYAIAAYATSWWPWESTVPTARFLPEAQRSLFPEPRERFLYVFGLLCLAALPLAIYGGLGRYARRHPEKLDWLNGRGVCWVRDVGLLGGAVCWLLGLASNSQLAAGPRLAAVGLISLSWPWLRRIRLRVPRGLVRIGVLGLMLGGAGLLLITAGWLQSSHPGLSHHFEFLLGAINQVAHGKTVLVDTSSQYGTLYPYCGAWFTQLTGLNVLGVSLFFALLSLLALLLLYLALERKFGATSGAGLAFLAVFGLFHPVCGWSLSGCQDYEPVPYYQYVPLRVVWGAFFLWFVPGYLEHRSGWRKLLGFAAAGWAVLWNADTGLVILLAWTLTLMYTAAGEARGRWNIVRTVAVQAVGLGLTLGLSLTVYWLWAWARSGRVPQLTAYWHFQQMFYRHGLMMSPMPCWEFWQPLVLIYLVTVFSSLRRLVRLVHVNQAAPPPSGPSGRVARRADVTSAWYLFIALYGLGIFSYYQGRSDLRNLFAISFPAVFLSCCLVADQMRRLRGISLGRLCGHAPLRFELVKLLLLAWLPLFGISSFLGALGPSLDYARQLCRAEESAEAAAVWRELRPLVEGTELVICCENSNYLHVQTGSWSALPVAAPGEIMLVEQAQAVQELLDQQRPRLVVARSPEGQFYGVAKYLDLRRYRPVLERQGLVVFEPSPP